MPHDIFLHPPGQQPATDGRERPVADRVVALGQTLTAKVSTPPPDAPRVHVSEVASTFSLVYERLRNAVEYHEDHLLRKNAIERILRRRSVFGLTTELDPTALARRLVAELIRGGYLPNDEVPEAKVERVAAVIARWLSLLQQVAGRRPTPEGHRTYQWLVPVLAVDVEEELVPPTNVNALVRYAYGVLKQDIRWRGAVPEERLRDLQLYLATYRSVARADTAMVRTHLLHLYEPRWREADQTAIDDFARRLPRVRAAIDAQAVHPLGEAILRRIKRSSIAFLALRDAIEASDDWADTLVHPARLQAAVAASLERRYATKGRKTARAALRAIIYILLTKTLLAILIEYPYERLVAGGVSYLPLTVNVAFHPFFLALLALSARIPAAKNTERVCAIVEGLTGAPAQRHVPIEIRRPRRGVLTTVFQLLYGLTYLVTFGLIVVALRWLHFNALSIAIFLFFLSLTSFFGLRIRLQTKELIVLGERENILSALIDLFTVPILQVGRWLSLKAPRVNVLIFFMDFILEAPVKAFIEVVEGWFAFLKEKKEEVY